MSDDKFPPPPSGIPGMDMGVSAANMWLRVLTIQMGLVNDAWARMKQGTYSPTLAFQHFVEAVEAPIEVWKELWPQFVPGAPTPPVWVNFQWGKEPEHLSVNLNKRLEVNENLKDAKLARLGGSPTDPGPHIRAERTGATVAKISLVEPGSSLPAGQYLGFIESDRSTTPLIVVTVTVPEDGAAGGRASSSEKKPVRRAAASRAAKKRR